MSNSVRPHRRQPTRLPRPWDSPGKNTGVGCHFLPQCMKVKSESEVALSCLTLGDPMDCSLSGPSIHGIFQARVLEWGAIAFSEGRWTSVVIYSQAPEHSLNSCGAGDWLLCSMWDFLGPGIEPTSPASAGRFFTTVPSGKPHWCDLNLLFSDAKTSSSAYSVYRHIFEIYGKNEKSLF